jgi:hypothetical protein
VSIRIYVEGGFEGSTKSNCRRAFGTFLGKVIPTTTFKVIASGTRQRAYEDFGTALRQRRDDSVMLLVDSETAVTVAAWQHLNQRQGDGWNRPAGATDDQVHLMVQVMEAWFLADQQTLAGYYGQGFLRNSLPRQPNVEQIDKDRVFAALRRASTPTKKGAYHKTRHGFELLELIDPALVRRASAHAEALLSVLSKWASP